MPQLHETMMGKRFIEGTVPQLVRAVEKLNKNLEPKVEYEIKVVTLFTREGERRDLENIENQKFNSVDELREINGDICIYSMSDFMDMCNNEDSDFLLENESLLHDRWIGYIQLRKGAIQEYNNKQQGDK